MQQPDQMKRTPLFEAHVALGARMVPFAGWEMPVQYTSILDEARAVRAHAGLFDVSHMGRATIRGSGAPGLLDRILSFDVPGLRVGRARYGVVCTQEGGIIDDCILYRRHDEDFLLVPNASNTQAVLEWLLRWMEPADDVSIEEATSETAMIALQGPKAAAMLSELSEPGLPSARFSLADARVAGIDTLLAHTGYTGEDGYELFMPRAQATELWNLLRESGATPSGLAARDILRLEAGLLLHGNDIDVSTNPYEAGLNRFVDPDRDGYVASDALRHIRDRGATRALVGFKVVGRGVARHGHPIVDGTKRIGSVTSGGYSPTLDMNIGMGYVPTGFSSPGSRFQVDIRGRLVEAEVVGLPFYSRSKSS